MASVKAGMDVNRLLQEGFEPPEGLVAVAVHDNFARSGEAGLVILAMGRAYWTLQYEDVYVLCVDEFSADIVREELAACALLDSKRADAASFRYTDFKFSWLSFFVYMALLVVVFIAQDRYGLVDLGRGDSVAIIELKEWWRAVTALMLHADVVHLISNLVAGMGFAFFVARFFGATGGWILILLSGTAGNMLNAWVYYPEPHFSIGASTAVFGALGLLTGVGIWSALVEPQERWTLPKWLVPVFGGFTLLGLIGVGDGLVDVAAHISGFVCGIVMGVLGALWQRAFMRLQNYRVLSVIGVFSFILCAWLLAFWVG